MVGHGCLCKRAAIFILLVLDINMNYIMKLQKPKGTQDILPIEAAKWQYVENLARETFKKYNYCQ